MAHLDQDRTVARIALSHHVVKKSRFFAEATCVQTSEMLLTFANVSVGRSSILSTTRILLWKCGSDGVRLIPSSRSFKVMESELDKIHHVSLEEYRGEKFGDKIHDNARMD